MDIELARWLVATEKSPALYKEGAYTLLHVMPCSIADLVPLLPDLRATDVRLDKSGWRIFSDRLFPLFEQARAVIAAAEKGSGTSEPDPMLSPASKTAQPEVFIKAARDDGQRAEEVYRERRLPRYGFVTWDVLDERRIDATSSLYEGRQQARRSKLLAKIAEGSVRHIPIATSAHINAVRDLMQVFPHFEAVINSVVAHLKFQRNTDAAVGFEPILLDGPPGVGKTAFCRALVAAIDGSLHLRSMAEATAGFVFTGNSPQWSEADAGVFAHMMAEEPTERLPVLLLDELDKARGGNFPPDQVLLGVLEPSTAKIFRDEFLQLTFDVSPIPIIATCNRTSTIRPELVSRFHHFYIPEPDRDQMPAIIRSVDRALRTERPELNEWFAPLDETVMAQLATSTPRELRRQLLAAYASAMETPQRTKRYRLKPAHLPGKPLHPEAVRWFRRLSRTDEPLH